MAKRFKCNALYLLQICFKLGGGSLFIFLIDPLVCKSLLSPNCWKCNVIYLKLLQRQLRLHSTSWTVWQENYFKIDCSHLLYTHPRLHGNHRHVSRGRSCDGIESSIMASSLHCTHRYTLGCHTLRPNPSHSLGMSLQRTDWVVCSPSASPTTHCGDMDCCLWVYAQTLLRLIHVNEQTLDQGRVEKMED